MNPFERFKPSLFGLNSAESWNLVVGFLRFFGPSKGCPLFAVKLET